LSWRRDRCLVTFESLTIDVERVLIDPLTSSILICISDLTLFTHLERVSKSSFLKYTSVLSKSAILPNDTSYTRGGVNQMWILTNSKDLLEYIQSRSLSSCNSIKTFDFSTLYTTIPHSKLKDRLRELVQLCFIKKNGQRRYKYLVLGKDQIVFCKKNPL
jgi:hypothetical protein